jgi:hypothetical protein
MRDRYTIYPLCEDSLLSQVPDDVHPDYLKGVRETIFMIFETPPNTTFGTPYTKQEQQSNIEFASGVLNQLSLRFPKGRPDEPTNYDQWHRQKLESMNIES